MLAKRPQLAKYAARGAARHLEEQVPDPDLRRRLTPHYALGCKRVLLSNDYYPALTRPNVELVTDPIGRVTADAVVTADGTAHPVDTIILGTGFAVSEPPIARGIVGADGRTLAQHWAGSPTAYLGSTVAGFPNLFVIVGPNTGLGHSSMIFMMESQANYIVDACKTMAARSIAAFSVDRDRRGHVQRRAPGPAGPHGVELGLLQLVPRRLGAELDLVARLHLAVPAAHPALRRRPVLPDPLVLRAKPPRVAW